MDTSITHTKAATHVQAPSFDLVVPAVHEVSVVVVDDERVSLELVARSLTQLGHPVRAFSAPRDALSDMRANPPAVLVTDLVMPEISGVELVREARRIDPDMGLVLVTGVGDEQAAVTMGGLEVSAYLTKPVDRAELLAAVQGAYLNRAAREHHQSMVEWMYATLDRNAAAIRDVTMGTLGSLMNALDARSSHFQGHSRAVAMQAAAVAQTLQLSDKDIDEIHAAGLLHDIGMIGVPDAIVDKPSTLSEEEAALIRTHCEAGASIIEPMRHLGSASLYVLEHHERLDGSGYPHGKRAEEISLGGQIVGIAEAWVGILDDRAYREGRPREEGMEILLSQQGRWFSSELTEALMESDIGVIG